MSSANVPFICSCLSRGCIDVAEASAKPWLSSAIPIFIRTYDVKQVATSQMWTDAYKTPIFTNFSEEANKFFATVPGQKRLEFPKKLLPATIRHASTCGAQLLNCGGNSHATPSATSAKFSDLHICSFFFVQHNHNKKNKASCSGQFGAFHSRVTRRPSTAAQGQAALWASQSRSSAERRWPRRINFEWLQRLE